MTVARMNGRAACRASPLFAGVEDLADTHAQPLAVHHHFAARDEAVGSKDLDRLAGELVHLHDGPFGQIEQISKAKARATELDADVELDVAKLIESLGGVR